MPPAEPRTFRIGDFAARAGVSVRALRHYDRCGLLRPRRTAAGYRVYTSRDIEVVEQIVALKLIGIPLCDIRTLRQANRANLARALWAQARALQAKRRLLDQTIGAIEQAQRALASGDAVDPSLFHHIIEVIEMHNDTEAWTRQYDALVAAKLDRLSALTPEALAGLRTEWATLVKEVESALDTDPAGARAQALAARWVALLERLMGGPVPKDMIGLAATPPAQAWPGAQSIDPRVWGFVRSALAAGKS